MKPARPLPVTIIGAVYILVGAIGFIYHFRWQLDVGLVELVRLAAIWFGVALLRGQNWARWLTLAWMALHVVISAFNGVTEVAMHILFLVVLSYLLFRPAANAYFRG